MKFTFSPEDGPALRGRLAGFHLFSQGRSRKIRNVLRGRAGDTDVLMLDYRYTTGSGKNSHTWEQTVMVFESAGAHFPDFSLRPEHIFHKLTRGSRSITSSREVTSSNCATSSPPTFSRFMKRKSV
jgi:hypothetical protein